MISTLESFSMGESIKDAFALPFWNKNKMEFTGSQRTIARRIVAGSYLERIDEYHWKSHPIPSRNSKQRVKDDDGYLITLNPDTGLYICNCFWAARHPVCSHILAVLMDQGVVNDLWLKWYQTIGIGIDELLIDVEWEKYAEGR